MLFACHPWAPLHSFQASFEEKSDANSKTPAGDVARLCKTDLTLLREYCRLDFVVWSCSGPFESDRLEEMPETVIPRAMLQGANETGDYFWDVWREPNDHAARYRSGPRRFFLTARFKRPRLCSCDRNSERAPASARFPQRSNPCAPRSPRPDRARPCRLRNSGSRD